MVTSRLAPPSARQRLLNILTAGVFAAAAVAAVASHLPASAQALAGARQSTAVAGVTVTVTPKPSDAGWQFTVVFDTHSGELEDDLLAAAVLVVDGRELQPISWDGPGPGGHHREGVLRFASAGEQPTDLELRLQRAGEDAPRVFRWKAADLR